MDHIYSPILILKLIFHLPQGLYTCTMEHETAGNTAITRVTTKGTFKIFTDSRKRKLVPKEARCCTFLLPLHDFRENGSI